MNEEANIVQDDAPDSSSKTAEKIRRTVRGMVISDSMSKTLVVKTERLVRHRKYHKYIRKYTKYYAHDETEQAHVGDFVELVLCRPLSKLKRWELVKIIRMAPRDDAPNPEDTVVEIEEGEA
ncbi:MAG: 30S ribosomal protein S17 [Planctomycetota bacterium]|nr:30S ribosomal protein S17 [Planctomycetota bacterium]